MMQDRPTVSVCLLTYNQERTIAQAVQGALKQETSFPMEIVVGEDASKDETLGILRRIATAHPGRLRVLAHERNLGAAGNFAAVLAACRGEFIAVLEGDDFWTHPYKLQRQVELLRRNPSLSLCYHDVDLVTPDGLQSLRRFCLPKPPAVATGLDLLQCNFIPTCSVVIRASALPTRIPTRISALRMQDWPTWLHAAKSGDLGYIDECWGAYRIHPQGLWTGLPRLEQQAHTLAFYRAVRPTLPKSWRETAGRGEKQLLALHIDALIRTGRWAQARPHVRRYLTLAPRRFSPPRGKAGMYLRVLASMPSEVMRTPSSEE